MIGCDPNQRQTSASMLVICEPPSPDGREKSPTCKKAKTSRRGGRFSHMPCFSYSLLNRPSIHPSFFYPRTHVNGGARDTSRLGNHTAARHTARAKYDLREPMYALSPSEPASASEHTIKH